MTVTLEEIKYRLAEIVTRLEERGGPVVQRLGSGTSDLFAVFAVGKREGCQLAAAEIEKLLVDITDSEQEEVGSSVTIRLCSKCHSSGGVIRLCPECARKKLDGF